jgi:hypothetical protein
MCSTVLAVDIKFIDNLATLRALVLDLALVHGRMSREEVDSQELICFSLGLVDGVKSLELDKGSAALSKAAVEEGCDCDQTVNIFGLELLFVFDKSHSCLHGTVVILLVELSLAKEIKMDCFSTFPRVR